jgi:hypothetical protein
MYLQLFVDHLLLLKTEPFPDGLFQWWTAGKLTG